MLAIIYEKLENYNNKHENQLHKQHTTTRYFNGVKTNSPNGADFREWNDRICPNNASLFDFGLVIQRSQFRAPDKLFLFDDLTKLLLLMIGL